jgi:hypothetical protein
MSRAARHQCVRWGRLRSFVRGANHDTGAMRRRCVLAGLLLAVLAQAQGPAAAPRQVSVLADARYKAAIKQFDETWTYYQQARIDSYQVYVWSKLVMDSRRELTGKAGDRITAIEDHLARMKSLESLVKKIRKIGFGRSYDVGATEYYRLEAEYWLALEKSGK